MLIKKKTQTPADVHTMSKMRLWNKSVGDGGQCESGVCSFGPHVVATSGCYSALPGSDRLPVTFSMRSRHSALSIQSMASHWIPSLRRQRHTNTMYLHKYKQLGRHNCSIMLRGPDKMSRVQAAGPLYKKTTVRGRNWDDPKPLAVCLFCHEKAQPPPPPPARAASAIRSLPTSQCTHQLTGPVCGNVLPFRDTPHLLYSSCSREKMCLLKYSCSFSLA